jgi:hypothetical protein
MNGGGHRRAVLQPIGPLREEENYELSEKETDSEREESTEVQQARRRAKKVPEWCRGWRELCMKQMAIDPESIFGIYIPNCDLGVIFADENYKKMRKTRPRRNRGSSGNWKMDKLRQEEIDTYRNVCGQILKADGVFV